MSKLLEEQLKKCKVAKIEEIQEEECAYFIKKYASLRIDELDFIINHCYNIHIKDYIINEPPNFTLSSNWNNGIKPTDSEMNVEVNQIMGKMIKVTGVGVNDKQQFIGWLPKGGCTILKELV